jgi:hypothetical protein
MIFSNEKLITYNCIVCRLIVLKGQIFITAGKAIAAACGQRRTSDACLQGRTLILVPKYRLSGG